jgi:predicted transcriptional regulator
MSGALTVDEALGPSLEQVIVAALASAARPARSAVCPVCSGTMRRLVEVSAGVPAENALVCGECGSSIEDGESQPPPGQLRLVS